MSATETRRSCIDCGTTICDKLKGEHPEFCLSTALDQETIDKVTADVRSLNETAVVVPTCANEAIPTELIDRIMSEEG